MSNDYEESYFDEPAPAPRQPSTRRPRGGGVKVSPPWLVAGLVVVVAIALVVYFAAIRSTGNPTSTGPISTTGQSASHYNVSYPKDWSAVNPNGAAPGQHAFAAFRQKDGKGIVVMRLEPKVTISRAYLRSLEGQLKRTVPDYRFVGSHALGLPPGEALDLTYYRTSLHQVRNVVVLPLSNLTVVMATIGPIGDKTIADEISGIVNSFTISS